MKRKTISDVIVTVVYPVTTKIRLGKINLKDEKQILKIKQMIYKKADSIFEQCSIKPIIHECDILELID